MQTPKRPVLLQPWWRKGEAHQLLVFSRTDMAMTSYGPCSFALAAFTADPMHLHQSSGFCSALRLVHCNDRHDFIRRTVKLPPRRWARTVHPLLTNNAHHPGCGYSVPYGSAANDSTSPFSTAKNSARIDSVPPSTPSTTLRALIVAACTMRE